MNSWRCSLPIKWLRSSSRTADQKPTIVRFDHGLNFLLHISLIDDVIKSRVLKCSKSWKIIVKCCLLNIHIERSKTDQLCCEEEYSIIVIYFLPGEAGLVLQQCPWKTEQEEVHCSIKIVMIPSQTFPRHNPFLLFGLHFLFLWQIPWFNTYSRQSLWVRSSVLRFCCNNPPLYVMVTINETIYLFLTVSLHYTRSSIYQLHSFYIPTALIFGVSINQVLTCNLLSFSCLLYNMHFFLCVSEEK